MPARPTRGSWRTPVVLLVFILVLLGLGHSAIAAWAQPAYQGTLPNYQLSLTWQRPNAPAPDDSWAVPVTVSFYVSASAPPAYAFQAFTNRAGQIYGYFPVPAGTYDIALKGSHTLARVQRQVTVTRNGPNRLDFGQFWEGDVSDDNRIGVLDLAQLRATYARADGAATYNAQGDLDVDHWIGGRDLSLLWSNYFKQGEQVTDTGSQWARPAVTAPRLWIRPQIVALNPGAVAGVELVVDPAGRDFDTAHVQMRFDPALVQIVTASGQLAAGIQPGDILLPFYNYVDNQAGDVIFAGIVPRTRPAPSDSFVLLTMHLRAEAAGISLVLLVDHSDLVLAGRTLQPERGQAVVIAAQGTLRQQFLPFSGRTVR